MSHGKSMTILAARRPAYFLSAALLVQPALAAAQATPAAPPPVPVRPLEQNPAPEPTPTPPPAAPPITVDESADATPLEMNLARIVLIADTALPDTNQAGSTGPVDVSRVGGDARLARQLAPFIGRPLSRRLIAEIKATVLREQRRRGRPLAHISVPEQDISAGRLVLRLDTYRLGRATVTGAAARSVSAAIRQREGTPVDMAELAEDLSWLNRYPFRRVEAMFASGREPGTTDLTYAVQHTRPFSLGAGYGNSGSPASGLDRAFVYALAALPVLPDAWASYQLTTSGQRLAGLGQPPAGARRYVSHAGRLVVPLAPRLAVDASFADIRSTQGIEAFDVRQHTRVWSAELHTALSGLDARLAGELSLGVDFKQQRSRVLFAGQTVSGTAFDVGQIVGSYSWRGFDPRGETALQVTVHASPGGLGALATGTAYANATQSRVRRARFFYLSGMASRTTTFGPVQIAQTLGWQYSTAALPPTELLGIGGRNAVRGYTLDDGAYDRGVTLQTELRLTDPFVRERRSGSTLSPFVYADLGYAGRAHGPAAPAIGALGAGIDLTLLRRLSLTADAGLPLVSQGATRAYRPRVNLRLSVGF